MRPLKTLAIFFSIFIANSAFAQNFEADSITREKKLEEIYIRSKVDLLKLLLKFTSKNFAESMPDSTFRYNFQFTISTQANESAQITDSASGCFYITSKKGKYKYLSTLQYGELETSGLRKTEKTSWGFSLPGVFSNNPLDDEKSLALERTEKGTYVKFSNDGVSRIFHCYNKWIGKPGYEKLMYPHLSYIYYFDSLNRLDSATVFTLDRLPNKNSDDTSLFRTSITYCYSKSTPRILSKAICLIYSLENGKILATQRLVIESVPIQQPIRLGMTKDDKLVSVFRNIIESCLQFDHLKEVSD